MNLIPADLRVAVPNRHRFVAVMFLAFGVLAVSDIGWSQTSEKQSQEIKKVENEESLVQMNFPQEIEVKGLVDYVSERLKINILYDQEIANKKISIKGPEKIPINSLPGVLESALKMKGLALVDADAPGWKRIVSAKTFPNVASSGEAADAIAKYGNGVAVTQAFVLRQAAPEQVDQLIKPFLTEPGANSIALPHLKTIIITDYATNLLKIARWIELLDQPRPETMFEFVTIEHVPAANLASQVTAIMTSKARVGGATKSIGQLELIEDARTNRILLIGQRGQIDEVRKLITSLDIPLKLTTRTYSFKHVGAASIDRLVQQLVATQAGNWFYRSVVDSEENLLVVTATEDLHQQVEAIKTARDTVNPAARSPVCFYKVKNLPATELLETIRSIERESEKGSSKPSGWPQMPTDGRTRTVRQEPNGPNRPPAALGSTDLPTPPAVRDQATGASTTDTAASATAISAPAAVTPHSKLGSPSGEVDVPTTELLGRARVTADVHTNTLIVIADPATQRLYADLIDRLDQQRLQVLVEVRFVVIDTSNDFSFGIEVSGGARSGINKLFAFSSYGLSTVTASTGALAIIPGTGFNGTLVDSDVADAVIRAVSTNSRAKVISAPRILVNDNASGQLSSVEEVPYSSVNASQTVATTTFAGFADAGTTITVTPHISDDTRLQLDLRITLNSFTGSSSNHLPPPRKTQEVSSQITIPDGQTVIVGGLNRDNNSYSYSGIPLLADIPIVREITGLTTKSNTSSSMFVFIRPVILRDDKFRGLKFLSGKDIRCAGICPDYPASTPIWME